MLNFQVRHQTFQKAVHGKLTQKRETLVISGMFLFVYIQHRDCFEYPKTIKLPQEVLAKIFLQQLFWN